MAWKAKGYTPRSCGKAVLLLGNGLNWAGNGPSWSQLLKSLKTSAGFSGSLDESTPFPLLYEELYLHALNRKKSEDVLPSAVSEHTARIPVTQLLERVKKLPIKHLLTTNYDAATVTAFLGDDGRSAAPVRESRYSLFRRRERGGRVVWPIHGEGRQAGSIMLGYEHYCGYLEQMRKYVTSGVRYQDVTHESLVKSLSAAGGLDLVRSWVDFFFTKRVIILGLTLDVEELHLWWLLTYRARRRAEGKRFIRGDITFITGPLSIPSGKNSVEGNQRRERNARVRRLLKAAGVQVVEVSEFDPNDRRVHYDAALDEAERLLTSAS